MDDPVLSPAEAELLDYTATLRRCCERLSIERHDVAQLLSAPPDDPFYLPHVRVRSCGRTGLAYRVRPDDLEALAARISTPPLPPDPIRPRDAIAVRAGERVRGGSRRYSTYASQLVRDPRVTRYVLRNGAVRYSRAEVEALNRSPARAKRLEAEGLVNSAKAAALTGYTAATVVRWGQKGLYGARKVGGAWWIPRDQLPPKHKRTASPPMEVSCSVCHEGMTRKASEVRRTLARDGGRIFCPKCWAARREEVLKANRTFPEPTPETRAKMSAAQRRTWQEGKHDLAHMDVMRERLEEVFKSPSRNIERANRVSLGRGGNGLTEERKSELAKRTRRRAQRDSPAAVEADEHRDRTAEMHAQGLDLGEIAEELCVAIQTVKRYLAECGSLSERSPGRQEAKQRRRIAAHLLRLGGADERRNLQRATGLSVAVLSMRLLELGCEEYEASGRACVRLVSEESLTPATGRPVSGESLTPAISA